MTMPAGIDGIPGIDGDWAEAVVTTANVNKARNVSRRNIEHLLGNVGGVYSTLVASRHLELPGVGAVGGRTLNMRTTRGVCVNVVALVIVVLLATGQSGPNAQQTIDPAIRAGANDLGGVVTSVKGPEAGVWVIAETTDLPTKFAKIVVTDDQGRYLIPDLPKVGYNVWVRGYGLIDSPKIRTSPGKVLNLRAVTAPSPAAAAAAGRGAQRRHHPLGLGRAQGLPARRGLHRQAQPAGQRQRPDLRRDRGEYGPLPGARSGEAQGDAGQDARARSQDALVEAERDAPVAVLGPRADLGQPEQHAQPDARRERTGLVHVARRRAGQSRLLQKGVGAPVGEAHAHRDVEPASLHVRSEDREDHADPHVLPDPPPGLRRGCQQHAVDERGRPAEWRHRLAQPQGVRGDR